MVQEELSGVNLPMWTEQHKHTVLVLPKTDEKLNAMLSRVILSFEFNLESLVLFLY